MARSLIEVSCPACSSFCSVDDRASTRADWAKAANSAQANAMRKAIPAFPTFAWRSMPESGAISATIAGGTVRAAAGADRAPRDRGADRARLRHGTPGEGGEGRNRLPHRVRLRAVRGFRPVRARRRAIVHAAEAGAGRAAHLDERARHRGRDPQRRAALPGDPGCVRSAGGAALPAPRRALGGRAGLVPSRPREGTRSLPGGRGGPAPGRHRQPARRIHRAAAELPPGGSRGPRAPRSGRGPCLAGVSALGRRPQAGGRVRFLFALGRGDDGLRGRGGGRRAHAARADRHALRLGLPAAGLEDRDGRRSVVARILVVAALLCTAAVAQQRPQPLTLDEAVKLALQRNTDLQRQILLSLSAEQDRIIARSAVLPHADFNASIAANRQGAGTVVVSGVGFPQPTSNYSTTAVGLNLSQLIFDGGKWWNNISAANLGLAASEAQVDEQRLQITYLVEQRFYELVRAQRQLQVFTEAATRSRDQANYTQRLFEGGRATQADVYAARANRDNDEVLRLGQERVVELARSDLSTAIGLDPGSPLSVSEPQNMMSTPAQPPRLPDAISRALDSRPSLKAFALTTEQSRKLFSAAKGDYWPTVSVVVQWSRSTTETHPFFAE